jgi:hypothetical protein
MIEVTFLCQKKRYGKSGTEGARYGLGPGTEGAVRKERYGTSPNPGFWTEYLLAFVFSFKPIHLYRHSS